MLVQRSRIVILRQDAKQMFSALEPCHLPLIVRWSRSAKSKFRPASSIPVGIFTPPSFSTSNALNKDALLAVGMSKADQELNTNVLTLFPSRGTTSEDPNRFLHHRKYGVTSFIIGPGRPLASYRLLNSS